MAGAWASARTPARQAGGAATRPGPTPRVHARACNSSAASTPIAANRLRLVFVIGLYDLAPGVAELGLDAHAFGESSRTTRPRLGLRGLFSIDQRTAQGRKSAVFASLALLPQHAAGLRRETRLPVVLRGWRPRPAYRLSPSCHRTTTAPSPSTSYCPPAPDRRQARHDLGVPDGQHPAIPVRAILMRRPHRDPPSRAWRRRMSPRPSGRGCARAFAGSWNSGKRANSSRRPLRTASASSGPKSQKKGKGCAAPHSSPMNSIGICGSSR